MWVRNEGENLSLGLWLDSSKTNICSNKKRLSG